MKDYSENRDDGKTFITNYDIKDGNIIVHFATESDLLLLYNEENINNLLEKMENQVQIANESLSKIKHSIRKDMFIAIVMFILVVTNISPNPINFSLPNILHYMSIWFGTIATLSYSLGVVLGYAKKREITKMNLFMQKKQILSDSVFDEQKQKILSGFSKETKKQVEFETKSTSKIIDINSLDKLSLTDLRKIIVNTENNKQSNLSDEQESIEKDSIMVLKPTSNTKRY